MKRFAYLAADSFPAAAKALAASENGVAKSAGTDLLDLLKERVLEPDEIVNLLGADRSEKQGELSALATLAEVAVDEWIHLEFPAVRAAAEEAATPQIRNRATLGGNLCQVTRCWFLRNPGYDCYKLGGAGCAAMEDGAHNRYHALFPHKRCACAHPSNLAPALLAVGAKVALVHPDGNRVMDLELIYDRPRSGRIGDTALRPGELIRAVVLEASALARNSAYVEFRERLSSDFAVASAAVAADVRDHKVFDIRIFCGAIAPTPHRATAAEAALRGKPLTNASIDAAVEAALKGAEPLSQNRYKIPILKRVLKSALQELKS